MKSVYLLWLNCLFLFLAFFCEGRSYLLRDTKFDVSAEEHRELKLTCEKIAILINRKDWKALSGHLSEDCKRLVFRDRCSLGLAPPAMGELMNSIEEKNSVDMRIFAEYLKAVQTEISNRKARGALEVDPADKVERVTGAEEALYLELASNYVEFDKVIQCCLEFADHGNQLQCGSVYQMEIHDDHMECLLDLRGNFPFAHKTHLRLYFVKDESKWFLSHRELHVGKDEDLPVIFDLRSERR